MTRPLVRIVAPAVLALVASTAQAQPRPRGFEGPIITPVISFDTTPHYDLSPALPATHYDLSPALPATHYDPSPALPATSHYDPSPVSPARPSTDQESPDPARSSTLEVQTFLKDHGYDPGPLDGVPGPRTAAAVQAFQSAKGLTVDGIVGSETRKAMDASRSSSQPRSVQESETYAAPIQRAGATGGCSVAPVQDGEGSRAGLWLVAFAVALAGRRLQRAHG